MTAIHHEAESHHMPPAVVANQQRHAVIYFIIGDAVFFACLVFTYFYLRALNVSGGWIPAGGRTASAGLVWVIALLTVASAAVYRGALAGGVGAAPARFKNGALGALLLALVAFALSVYQLATLPILLSDGSYASVFITLAAVQLLHVGVLLFVAAGIVNRAVKGLYDHGASGHPVVVGYFWNWVAATAFVGALLTFFVR